MGANMCTKCSPLFSVNFTVRSLSYEHKAFLRSTGFYLPIFILSYNIRFVYSHPIVFWR